MSNVKYVAVNTKLRAMESKFFKNEDFEAMLACGSVEKLAEYLKSSRHYEEKYKDINAKTTNREELEHYANMGVIEDIDRLISFFHGKEKEFMKVLYLRYEIEQLKLFARRIVNSIRLKDKEPLNEASFPFLGKYCKIDRSALLLSSTLADIVRVYASSKISRYVVPLLANSEDISLFKFETTLDLAYHSSVMRKTSLLSGYDKLHIRELLLVMADLYNLQWILRGKYFYNIHPDILFNYSIPMGKKISKSYLRELCYDNDYKNVHEKVRQTKYAFLVEGSDRPKPYMMIRIKEYLHEHFIKERKKDQMSLIQAFTHVLILKDQIDDITTIIELDKYHIEDLDVSNYLIKF